MSKHKRLWLSVSIILFLALIALSIYYESTQYLYAASALPILIVLLLPDIQHQYIRMNKKHLVRFSQQGEGDEAAVSITFPPGYIQWSRSILYFRIDSVAGSSADKIEAAAGSHAVSLSVLPFDLCVHPRKRGWVGIHLPQLVERTRSLSITTDEVTRFVIRMSDLENAGMHVTDAARVSVPGNNTTMEA